MLHECLGNIWQGENCGPKQESHFSRLKFQHAVLRSKFEDVAFRCFSTCDHQTLHIIVFQYSETESIDTLQVGMQDLVKWSFCNWALVLHETAELLSFLNIAGYHSFT